MRSIRCKTLLIGLLLWMVLFDERGYAQDQLVISSGIAADNDNIFLLTAPIIREAYTRLGITIEIKQYPWQRSLNAANDGIVDGELYRVAEIQEEYPNLLMVKVPIVYVDFVVFTKDLHFQVKGWDSLRPYHLGFLRGVKKIEYHTQGMQVHMSNTQEATFKNLQIGRSDLVIDERFSGLQILNTLGFKDIQVLSPPLERFPSYHFLHTRHADLVPQVERILKQLEQEGFMEAVYKQVSQELFSPKEESLPE